MSYTIKPFEELDIMDDFLMNAVAGDAEVGEEFSKTLLKGLLQRELPNLFVITITNYDPFGYDYMMYTVHNKCEEIPELDYEDGLMFLYFNTTGTKGGNSSIKSLLNFIQDSTIKNVTDEVTQKLHDCISKVKISPKLRTAYMRWEEKLFYERLDGKIEGKIETVLELLEDIGVVPDELHKKISDETDLQCIRKWIKLAAKADSIEEFIKNM